MHEFLEALSVSRRSLGGSPVDDDSFRNTRLEIHAFGNSAILYLCLKHALLPNPIDSSGIKVFRDSWCPFHDYLWQCTSERTLSIIFLGAFNGNPFP